MLTASRALRLSSSSSPELPRIDALEALYRKGVHPRQGETIMIAGRSGSQKSGFALWLTANWNLPTLYLSADMSPFTAAVRLASMKNSMTTDQVVEQIAKGGRAKDEIFESIADLNIVFSFGNPIKWMGVQDEINAYVELWDTYPKVIVVDNLMDIEDCDSDYTAQQAAMSELTAIARNTGATTMILHHATDKAMTADIDPGTPPSRKEIKNGMSEKPELTLTVGLSPHNRGGMHEYRVACVKQRMGPSDPSAQSYVTLACFPEKTQFAPFQYQRAA